MLVIAPIMILTITGLIALMVNLVGDVLMTSARGTQVYQTQDALNKIEDDIQISTKFLSSYAPSKSPQGKDDNLGEFLSSQGDLIINQYTTDKNPIDPDRTIVYYANQPQACNSSEIYQNQPFYSKIIYFVKEEGGTKNLWRRTVLLDYNTSTGSPNADTLCAQPWQRRTCSPGYTNNSVCKGTDELMVSGIESMAVSYYTDTDYQTPTSNPDIASSIKVELKTTRKAAGENVNTTLVARATKLNQTTREPSAPGETINIIPTTPAGTSTLTGTTFTWSAIPSASSYNIRTRVSGGNWSGISNQTSTSYPVYTTNSYTTGVDLLPVAKVISIEVTPVNAVGAGAPTYYDHQMPIWERCQLQGSWVSYGGAHDGVFYTKTPSGLVVFKGIARDGATGTTSIPLCQMPQGVRPPSYLMHTALANQGYGVPQRMDIYSGGMIYGYNVPVGMISTYNLNYLASDAPITWINPAVSLNGWTNYGSPWQSFQYGTDTAGRINARGLVRPGTSTDGTAIVGMGSTNRPGPNSGEYLHLPGMSATSLTGWDNYTRPFDGIGVDKYGYIVSKGLGTTGYSAINALYYPNNTSANSGWTNLTMSNAWVPYGGGFAIPQYKKGSDGVVTLKGLVKNTVFTSTCPPGNVIAVLPAKFRPEAGKTYVYLTYSAARWGRVDINSSGQIICRSATGTWTALEGIHFVAES